MTPIRISTRSSILVLAALLAACSSGGPPPGDSTQAAQPARHDAGHAPGTGPNPTLPPPEKSLIPTIDIAPAIGWAQDAQPTPASGLAVAAFARGLDHPRQLLVLPNGDVLVAESNAQPKKASGGLKGAAKRAATKRAGAAVPAQTASPCCAMATATASPRRAACSSTT